MKGKKNRPTLNQIANIVERLERGQLAEAKVRAEVEKLITALPSDEVWEVPSRDTCLEDAIHDALVLAGRMPALASLFVEHLESDARVRQQIASVVAKVAQEQPDVDERLKELASHELPAVRLAMIRALGTVAIEPNAAAARLIDLVSLPKLDVEARDFVVGQLVWHAMESPAVCDLLLRAIREQRCYGRKELLTGVLHELAEADEEFVAWLMDRRDEADPDLRNRISYVIAESPLLPQLFSRIGASQGNRNFHLLAYVLGEIVDGHQADLVPLCLQALQDSDEGVRCGALLALWRLGPVAISVFEDVRRALIDDPSVVNRTLAAKALAAIDMRRARHEATQLVADAHARGDDAMRFEALIREVYAVPHTSAG